MKQKSYLESVKQKLN